MSKGSIVIALLFNFHIIQAQSNQHRLLLGISKVDHKLVLMDAKTYQVLNKVDIGEDPHEVTVSSDGKTAYVSNTGFGSLHEINVIDLVHQKAIKNIDTRPLWGPHGLSYTNNELWFTAQGSKAIGRYNPQTDSLDWSMGTGQNVTHLLYVKKDAKQIYATNVESGTVSILEEKLVQPMIPPTGKLPPNAKPRLDWDQTLIPVGVGAEGFAVTPDENELWTIKPDGTIAIINLSEKKLEQTINSKVLGLHRIGFSNNGKLAIIVSVRTGDLLVYDVAKRQEIKRLNIGQGAGIMVDEKENIAYISCTPNNYTIVFDLNKLKVIQKLKYGGRPDGITIAEWKD
ncbi:YncE family protein [Rhizosphaericola mali]|uniref:YncE family protein n=1 Tax=Rhizosphaericola mali TaxID=2545455 RepID=A0A5P2G5B7_9BACT|nr:YncE family protein [Rhizosphaericola mali]